MLIVFDGSDASGKSTQVTRLAEKLRDRKLEVVVLDHPTKTGLGGELRDLLHVRKQRFTSDAEAFLYAADVCESVRTIIQPALDRGAVVICHRWWYSSVVYQSYIDGCDLQLVTDISRQAAQIRPDLFFLLTVDPEVAMQRVLDRGGEIVSPYEKQELMSAVQQAWLEVFRSDINDAHASYTFDTTHLPVEALQAAIMGIVNPYLPPEESQAVLVYTTREVASC